jgi:PTH1 family peptidyl-tRNA hydrolase
MKLVVGLGNPGQKYAGTRHNIGFDVVSELARRGNADQSKLKFEAETTDVLIGTAKVLLLAPQTYMNASGRSVQAAVSFYQLELTDVFVICDDINLPTGRNRIRKSGSAGGQKGLKNICDHLRSDAVPRLRIGVGAPPGTQSGADYVLSKFAKVERVEMDLAVARAADAVECWAERGIGAAMNAFNAADS